MVELHAQIQRLRRGDISGVEAMLIVQAQRRATVEALAEVKNPKHATFVHQQNIAHEQQLVVTNLKFHPISP